MAKFLCTADLHIGRQSSGFDGETALGAFHRIVDLAINEQADAVLIAGDLFDSIDAQFMTRAHVAAGLERLKTNEIPVVAVAGNHDWDALPTFHHAYPGLLLLFDKDRWEAKDISGVTIIGRSFAGPTSKSLMSDFSDLADGKVAIGLLHADVDTKSPYNALPLADFAGRGVQAWVLGHVHACRHWQNPLVIYPGSPQALDAGETGIHGVRWLTVQASGAVFSETVPLSSARFEIAEVEIQPEDSIEDAILLYLQKVRHAEEKLSLRVRLIRRGGAAQSPPEGIVALGQDLYEIVEVVDAIEQDIDLEKEAEQSDARGQAARLLLGLEGKGDPAWIQQANALVTQVQTELAISRSKLKLGGREEFRVLANVPDEESIHAVRNSLECVLAATAGGVR